MKVALITGIGGQDGSYLSELLLSKGYQVHGVIRRSSNFNTQRIDHLIAKSKTKDTQEDNDRKDVSLYLHYGDVTDSSNMYSLMAKIQPDEVYHLAAQSHVKVSFELPVYTANSTGVGTLCILEAIRAAGLTHKTRFYQASSSELYGKVQEVPQRETTPFYPRSPYAVAKQYAYWIVVNYREAYDMFACNGILFNHESPRRGGTFVTKKITQSVADIYNRKQKCLYLGNLDSKRDWGHAKDYVEAMWRMLQQDKPDDFVVATGKYYSVREFVEKAFRYVDMEITWSGSGIDEVGKDQDGNIVVRVDPKYFRPTEVDELLGDPTKAKTILKWEPKYDIDSLVDEMMVHDLHNDT